MNPAWSLQQRQVLSALGHTLYRAVQAPAARVEPHDALASALVRAAGLDPATVDVEDWLRSRKLPPLASLRADPAAKRAIWPRLRALRLGGPIR